MLISFAGKITFFNIVNIIFGAIFGFFLMVMIFSAITSKVLSKYNKDNHIREISKKAYADFYLKGSKMKDKIISSLIYEIKEVSQQAHPDKKYPLYELSINEILGGIAIIQRKLKRVVNHPLCKDIKNMHVSTILSIEENIAKPVLKVYNNKTFKVLYKSYRATRIVLNVVNPIFYIKKIMYLTIFKKGKKDMIIICLDFIGNCCFEIYNAEKLIENQT